MDLGLADRVYVLTGASRGLGFATAQCLVADGARVVVSGRTADAVAAAVAAAGRPEHAVGLTADLADPGTAERLVAAARERFGRLDGALISVGGPPRGTAAAITDEQWRPSFETVFLGTVRPPARSPTALRRGRRDRAGALHLGPRPARPASASPTGCGPAWPASPRTSPTSSAPAASGWSAAARPDPDRPQPGALRRDRRPGAGPGQAEAAIPLRRLGDPAEFGRVAAFVLSPAASYLTGVAVPVDGGALRGL